MMYAYLISLHNLRIFKMLLKYEMHYIYSEIAPLYSILNNENLYYMHAVH